MDADKVLDDADLKFSEAGEHFATDLKALRTGRANAAMLDSIVVEVYGTTMPLNQVATVTAVDAQLIQISPFDPNSLESISNAIRNNPNLGLNPSDDGRVVRVPIPALTEERRREIAKQITQKIEEAAIRMRNIRHDSINSIDQLKKDKTIGEDDAKRFQKEIDDSMNKQRLQIDALAKAKEKEILTL
jgi:ribosome recycling factor